MSWRRNELTAMNWRAMNWRDTVFVVTPSPPSSLAINIQSVALHAVIAIITHRLNGHSSATARKMNLNLIPTLDYLFCSWNTAAWSTAFRILYFCRHHHHRHRSLTVFPRSSCRLEGQSLWGLWAIYNFNTSCL